MTLVSPANDLSEDDFKKKYAEWQVSFAKAAKEMNEASEDEKARTEAQQRYVKLYSERGKFMKEDRTGFVWLYLQK